MIGLALFAILFLTVVLIWFICTTIKSCNPK